MSSIGSVMTFGMNKILIGFTSTATAVFGVYFKLQSFVFMPVFGLNNGTVPIIAYNYGAAKPDRILKTLKLAICYAVGIMLIGFAVFQLLPDKLLLIFEASENMLSIGIPAPSDHFRKLPVCRLLHCMLLHVPGPGPRTFEPAGIRIPSASGAAASAFLLSKIGGLDLVWYSFPIAEICSIFFSTYFLRHVYKKEIEPLKRRGEN